MERPREHAARRHATTRLDLAHLCHRGLEAVIEVVLRQDTAARRLPAVYRPAHLGAALARARRAPLTPDYSDRQSERHRAASPHISR
jgi:hypothetical protein